MESSPQIRGLRGMLPEVIVPIDVFFIFLLYFIVCGLFKKKLPF